MTLPVSMDDKELFPKVDILNLTFSPKSEISEDVFKQVSYKLLFSGICILYAFIKKIRVSFISLFKINVINFNFHFLGLDMIIS